MEKVSEDFFFIIFEFENKEEIKPLIEDLEKHQYSIDNKYNTLTIFKDTLKNLKICI